MLLITFLIFSLIHNIYEYTNLTIYSKHLIFYYHICKNLFFLSLFQAIKNIYILNNITKILKTPNLDFQFLKLLARSLHSIKISSFLLLYNPERQLYIYKMIRFYQVLSFIFLLLTVIGLPTLLDILQVNQNTQIDLLLPPQDLIPYDENKILNEYILDKYKSEKIQNSSVCLLSIGFSILLISICFCYY